ncbi:MAG: RNA dependent RNA polymerase [Defluviitaleaceae bacterium]|nr:RNA dependent RNA polymerase [Defluviitaleaceae bacterium]
MAKKKMKMYQTFKAEIFNPIVVNGEEVPVINIVGNHLVINDECCDLRTIADRYDPETKTITSSVVDCISGTESVMAMHYGREYYVINPLLDIETVHNTLYDFITVDCTGGNDADPEVKKVKEMLCFDGLYMPLSKLMDIGYIPHNEAEIVELAGKKYVRYRAAMQSSSENRQCKLTMTTYEWESFAKTVSGDARYLYEPTQTAHKAIARQGLGKTNGNIVEDFKFTFAAVPDLETNISFSARCYNDSKNETTEETITVKKVATDGCGFITPSKARELTERLGLSYLPSAFQIRYGQIKGILIVFDFHKYSQGTIKEDILFTESMRKSEFDVNKAQFLVANVSKPLRSYTEFNYQMFTTLNSSLSFDDILPYVEDIKDYMEKALSGPEAALKFLGILSDISDFEGDDDNDHNCVDKVSAVIQANPQLSMNIRWIKQSIKRKIDLVSKKMLFGKIPMPHSSVSIMAPDPLAYFNRLRVYKDGSYGFADNDNADIDNGRLIVTAHNQSRELAAGEFRYGDYEGELLATRNPLTHRAQIRKLQCVNHKSSAHWYKYLGQVTIFNAHDETLLGMGGADHDGDMCINTKLFTDKFRQADYIIYNANDTGDKAEKVVLTEKVVQRGILANLQQNMLGIICNINTRCLELMNDPEALRKLVLLAGYTENRSFDIKDIPQMPYKPKFLDMPTATAYLERLNHQLTTLSELEVDRPKTGYVNRFCANQQEYTLPFSPYWFIKIKNQLGKFQNQPDEALYQNKIGEPVRALSKSYNNGKIAKMITDTLKSGSRGNQKWVQRTIEMMTDGETIMANIRRFVQEQILYMEIDANSCFSIVESIKAASILDMDEVERIMDAVRAVYKAYCRDIAGNIRAMNEGFSSQDDFNNSLENIINISDDALRAISTDRAALAYAAYVLSIENGYGSQSFPFLTLPDGMVALLDDVKTADYYEINLCKEVPRYLAQLLDQAAHIIVYNRRCRLPESVDPGKTYFGDVALTNGSYEVYRDLKGGISLIIPKIPSKDRLNMLPFKDSAEFSLKVSYKASELLPENQNGEYVTQLMADGTVTFKETTMTGNMQYCVYVDDIWVGTVFDDKANGWVLRKEIVKSLLGKDYSLLNILRTGAKTNSNSFTTGTGRLRTAQILTFTGKAC